MKLLIDTDPGTDDCHALTHFLKLTDVIAITTVFGNASVKQTTINACRILEMLGKNHVPVYMGAHISLDDVTDYSMTSSSEFLHGSDGMNDAVCIPEAISKTFEQDMKAPSAIAKIVTENPGEITLVALGPLTNIAIATRLFPELPKLVKGLYIMGSSSKFGNVTDWAEFNFHSDPLAAHVTLHHFCRSCKVHIVPWEPCLDNYITFAQFNSLFEGKEETPARKLVWATGMSPYLIERKNNGVEGYITCDQFISMILVYPESVIERQLYDHVNVICVKSDEKYGMATYVKSTTESDCNGNGVYIYTKFDMKYMLLLYEKSMEK